MIARLIAATAILFTLASTLARAAPPFAPVDTGFEGTRFRGVALGQSRAEVEAALWSNGLRCLTAEEYPEGVRQGGEYTVCAIVRTDFVIDNVTQFQMVLRGDLERRLGLPYYAVSFVNDVASVMTLETGYFNAGGTSAYDFAEKIVANYGLVNGMDLYGSGWRGQTANAEDVLVQTLYNGRLAILIVMAATEQTTPTFN